MFVYITGSLHTGKQRMIKIKKKKKKCHEFRWEIQSLTLLSGHCLHRSFLIKRHVKQMKFGYLTIIMR